MIDITDISVLEKILEAVLFSAGKPLTLEALMAVFPEHERPAVDHLKQALQALQLSYEARAVALVEVASGYRFQVNAKWAEWVSPLWTEKPARYSRALLETLALIAYRQPITRGEIEDIRGVAVSSSIIKTLLEEREWVRVVGHREVPGRPALYATTKHFLDYFGLKTLDQLPALPEVLNLEVTEKAIESLTTLTQVKESFDDTLLEPLESVEAGESGESFEPLKNLSKEDNIELCVS